MNVFFGLTLIITLALAASHRRFYVFRRSRLGASVTTGGWLLVAVGFLVGPYVTEIVPKQQLQALNPIIYFLLGWAGLIIGLQLEKRVWKVIPKPILLLSFKDCLLTLLVLLITLTLFLVYYTNASLQVLLPIGLIIAAVSFGWSPEVRSLYIGRHDQQPLAVAIRAVTGLASVYTVLVFGIMTMCFKANTSTGIKLASVGEMSFSIVLSIITGVAMGFICQWLIHLAQKNNRGEFLVVLIGVITFAAGAGATLGVASIFVTMITGIVLANITDKDILPFKTILIEAEQPIGMGMMLAAGLLMNPNVGQLGIYLVLITLAVRFIIKRLIVVKFLHRTANVKVTSKIANGLFRQNPLAIVVVVGLAISPFGIHASYIKGDQLLACMIYVGLCCEIWPLLFPNTATTADEHSDTTPNQTTQEEQA